MRLCARFLTQKKDLTNQNQMKTQRIARIYQQKTQICPQKIQYVFGTSWSHNISKI